MTEQLHPKRSGARAAVPQSAKMPFVRRSSKRMQSKICVKRNA
jgi:hypothetical protein